MSTCKVRFAPSPTGMMHIGNARVAIINYLFSRQNNGIFLFRIDDTDQNRSKKEYEDAIKEDIKWLNIKYDETFRQSDRLNKYNEILENLKNKNLVYKCYETEEELEFKRKKAILKGLPPIYDRAALSLSNAEINNLEAKNTPYYWRFKLPNKIIKWQDMVLGDISYNLNSISDPVIAKSNGTFLYSFCSVIDDIDSGITHILRGQDHVTNTAAQIAMINEINPNYSINFAHFSLLINKDGTQFSKRLNSSNLKELRDQGVDPMAICNLLATLGTSKDTKPFTNINDLINYFDINSFSSNPPKFDLTQLFLLNKKVIRNKSYEELKDKITFDKKAFTIIMENVETYKDIEKWNYILSPDYTTKIDKSIDVIAQFNSIIKKEPTEFLSHDRAQEILLEISKATNKSGKDLYMPIQEAIFGVSKGPKLADSLTILPIKDIINRTNS